MGIFTGLGVDAADPPHGSGAASRAVVGSRRPARLPIVAVTLYFTFSRGGIARRARRGRPLRRARPSRAGLVGALPAAGLPLAFALKRAYDVGAARPPDYAGGGRARAGPLAARGA